MASGVQQLSFRSSSAGQTRKVGAALGRVLEAGDVVTLAGDLGAGKTCFVQGMARGLDVPRGVRVASPTFTLVNEHRGRMPLYHIDLYRIEDSGELDELGLREIVEGDGVTAIEWMERFPDRAPPDRVEVRIAITSGRGREIIVGATGRAAARLGALQADERW